jgi:hypothetical protein
MSARQSAYLRSEGTLTAVKPCALCLSQKPLRDSHIVPEFMYREFIYGKHAGSNPKFWGISRDAFDSVRTYGKGIREKLLCGDCESKFSVFETYAADFFKGEIQPAINDGILLQFENLEYKKLKLFFMSLLWRFAVTSLKEFEGAKIIDKHKEKLRKMLYDKNPGKSEEYPCHITIVTHGGKHLNDFIMPPMLAKYEAHHIWQFVVGGFLFGFYVSSHAPTNILSKKFLTESGKLILHSQELRDIPPLYEFCTEIGNASLQRKTIPKKDLRWPQNDKNPH